MAPNLLQDGPAQLHTAQLAAGNTRISQHVLQLQPSIRWTRLLVAVMLYTFFCQVVFRFGERRWAAQIERRDTIN